MSRKKREKITENKQWRKLDFYYGNTINELPSQRLKNMNPNENLLNSLFCHSKPGTLDKGQDADTDSFLTPQRLNKLAQFNLNQFIETYTRDKYIQQSV